MAGFKGLLPSRCGNIHATRRAVRALGRIDVSQHERAQALGQDGARR